jgi:signal transduction histidine kinase
MHSVSEESAVRIFAQPEASETASAKAAPDASYAVNVLLVDLVESLQGTLPRVERDPAGAWLAPEIHGAVTTLQGVIGLLSARRERERERVKAAAETARLDDLIEGASLVYERWVEAAGCRLELRLASPLPAARLDPKRVRRLLDVLVHHVAVHARRGGTIALEACSAGAGLIEVAVVEEAPRLDAIEMARACKRYQCSRAGHGIDLASVDELVAALGGTLEVTDFITRGGSPPAVPPGRGVRYAARLPLGVEE